MLPVSGALQSQPCETGAHVWNQSFLLEWPWLWSMSHMHRSPAEAVFCGGPGVEGQVCWVRDYPVLQEAHCDCSVCGLPTLNGNVLLDIMDI